MVSKAMPILMLLLLLLASASMSHEHSPGRRRRRKRKKSECPARLSDKGNMSGRHAAAGLMHNQVDLPSRHSGQCEIGAHLPYPIFLGNRSQLLLSIHCSLPFTFSFIFLSGFVASSVKYWGFFSSLDFVAASYLCSPLIMQRSFIRSLHSSIPSKSPSILCSSLSSMSFFYLSSNFFLAILSIIQCTLLALGFWSCMGTLYHAYQFKMGQ